MRTPSAALAAALVVALGTVLARVPHAQDAQTPSFRAGVEALPVDVTVVDEHGQPIRDLIPADFTVRIDGRPRRVLTAQWIAAGSGARSIAAPAVPEGYFSNELSAGGRLIAIVIDQPNIPFGDMRPIHDAVNGFLDHLTPADRVAIIGLGQPGVTTAFLADKEQLKQAVARIPGQRTQPGGITSHEMGIATAMAIDRGDETALNTQQLRDCAGNTPRQRAPCIQEIQSEATSIAEQTRQASNEAMVNLREVLNSLKAIDGPKTLVYVSQGFFADRNRGDDAGRISELGTLASAARTSIYSLRMEDNAEMSRSRAPVTQMNFEDEMVRRYGLETLTAAAGGALFNLAGTGAAVFERISAELSGYYLLGVDTDTRDRDGRPHPIRVDVGRPNVTIRAHRTMIAGGPGGSGGDGATQATARTPKQMVTAALSSPLPAASLPIRAIAFSFRGLEPSKIRLLIHAEIGSGYTSPQRLPVAYYVVDKNGKSVDGQVTEVRLTPAANSVPSALVFTGGASVDPGDYTVRIAVADGERVGSLDLPIHASLLDLGRVRLTELLAGGPLPPVSLLRPSVGARISFGSVHGYLEAYGPDALALGVRFEIAADERGPAILSADVQGLIVGDERVLFSQTIFVQALPPGPYRLRAMIMQGTTLVTTLDRAFEIAPPARLQASTDVDATLSAATPGTPLYLPVEPRDLARPFDRDASLKVETLDAFQRRVPPAARAPFDEGIAHLRQREYKDAETSFKKAIQPDADSTGSLVYLGVTYASAGRDTQASSVWRTAMSGADDEPQLYEWLGEALMRLRSTGEARPIFEEAAARFPSDERFARPLALLYATFGRGLDAVRLLEKSVEKRRDDQSSLFLIVEWIFNTHRGGAVVHDRTEDVRLAHEYAGRYTQAGGLNEPLVRQWLNYLDKEGQ
jgi:VWFA-related protein